jgi:hypothetical protein
VAYTIEATQEAAVDLEDKIRHCVELAESRSASSASSAPSGRPGPDMAGTGRAVDE